MALAVVVEEGRRRVFASVLDWPGWSRSGQSEELALAALGDYRARYDEVLAAAHLPSPRGGLSVVERLPGDATTDFGAPGAPATAEARPLAGAAARRQCARLAACWQALDAAAQRAPAALRKGPRGGGRDRDAIVEHVLGAEVAYGRKIGIASGLEPVARRAAMLELLGAASGGAPLTPRGWPARYALRRTAWHALDHAFEIEDRGGLADRR